MSIICQELTSSITVYHEDGTSETRPPTSLMLRAARYIQQIENMRSNDLHMIHDFQHRLDVLTQEFNALNEKYQKLMPAVTEDIAVVEGQECISKE